MLALLLTPSSWRLQQWPKQATTWGEILLTSACVAALLVVVLFYAEWERARLRKQAEPKETTWGRNPERKRRPPSHPRR